MPNFKSTLIEDDSAFCKIVHYIHSNPVHHGFTKNITGWRFSSYQSHISEGTTRLERDDTLTIFGGKDAYQNYHKQPIDLKLSKLLES